MIHEGPARDLQVACSAYTRSHTRTKRANKSLHSLQENGFNSDLCRQQSVITVCYCLLGAFGSGWTLRPAGAAPVRPPGPRGLGRMLAERSHRHSDSFSCV